MNKYFEGFLAISKTIYKLTHRVTPILAVSILTVLTEDKIMYIVFWLFIIGFVGNEIRLDLEND